MIDGETERPGDIADTGFSKMLDKLFFQGKKGTLIECGASGGIHKSVGLYFEQHGWNAINIEANPEYYSELIVNRPDSVNLNLGLSDTVGEAPFRWSVTGPCGGTLQSERWKKFGGKKKGNAIVSTVTYKKMIEDLGLEKLDLFILDVEAHEFKVLRGMEGASVWPEYFVIETNINNPPELVKAALAEVESRSPAPQGYRVVGEHLHNTFFKRNS